MDIYRRYFRVESGPLIDEIKAINKLNEVAHEAYIDILKDVDGATTDRYYHIDNRLTGIMFDSHPDSKVFKKTKHGWYPKQNCKAGKELVKRLKDVKTRSQANALNVVGLSSGPSLFGGGMCRYSTLAVIPEDPPVIYVSTPWYDEDPSKIEQYKKDKAAGTRGDANFDSILWEPSPDMVEVKKWELDRHIDEWNEKHKETK